jgi:exonuclease III
MSTDRSTSKFTSSFWNVQHLGDKLQEEDFLSVFKTHDFVGLTETGSRNIENKLIPSGYSYFHNPIGNGNRKRNGHGILFLFRSKYRKYISKVNLSNPDFLGVRISKACWGLQKDVCIVTAYIPPRNSPTLIDKDGPFLDLENQVNKLQKSCYVLVGGDVNARTGNLPDFILHDDNDNLPSQPEPVVVYSPTSTILRSNMDKSINAHGRTLCEICKNNDLAILNGRTAGDSLGSFTCHKYNGSSCVDYVLCDPELFENTMEFEVGDLTTFSDHCIISSTFKFHRPSSISSKQDYDSHTETEVESKWSGSSQRLKLLWTDQSKCKLEALITSVGLTQKISEVLLTDDLGKKIEMFEGVLTDTAMKTMKPVRSNKTKKKLNSKKWFDGDCVQLRRSCNYLGRQVKRLPNDPFIRQSYFKEKKCLRKLIKYKKTLYNKKLADNLNRCVSNNPGEFWNLINNSNPTCSDDTSGIELSSWSSYFQQLHSDNRKFDNPSHLDIIHQVQSFEDTPFGPQLEINSDFETAEVRRALLNLKNKKAVGLDNICNEFLKYGCDLWCEPLTQIYNAVFSSGNLPGSWHQSYIVPIYKKGGTTDPNNYRGISVSNSISKVYFTIIESRMNKYVEGSKILCPEQLGFRKGYRTTDNTYIMKSIINNQLHVKNKKLFATFIDFSKAFDSVWRVGMLSKLIKYGINGKVFNTIKNIYQNSTCCVKAGNRFSDFFPSNIGVKQGCTLSPLLFNLFLADLPESLNSANSTPIQLLDQIICCLLYADDLVLLSDTDKGLQELLDALVTYCNTWGLQINIEKSKVMVFNKAGRVLNDQFSFKYNNNVLEMVSSYKYLGLLFTPAGKFNPAIKDLGNRGSRAVFLLKKKLPFSINYDPKISMKLFEAMIEPICLYNCEIWGMQKQFLKDSSPIEQINLKFCKEVLNVNRKTSNTPVRSELGRFPLYTKIICRLFKYWLRLLVLPNELLVKKAYLLEISNLSSKKNEGKNCWAAFVRDTLFSIGLGITWNNQFSFQKNSLPAVYESIRLRVTDVHRQDMSIDRENYLDKIKCLPHRSFMTKLRLESHSLRIETGRHCGLPRENRICHYCSLNEIEDVEHFITRCSAYVPLRYRLFDLVPCSLTDPDFDKTIKILNNPNKEVANIVHSFFLKRESIRNGQ